MDKIVLTQQYRILAKKKIILKISESMIFLNKSEVCGIPKGTSQLDFYKLTSRWQCKTMSLILLTLLKIIITYKLLHIL